MTDAPRTDLQDEIIDWARVDQLVDDIASEAELLGVLVKGGATTHAEGAARDLRGAAAALRAGRAAAIQVRYRHRGQEWWDTLLGTPDGRVRVVRTSQ